MACKQKCPLTPALRDVLRLCIEMRTISARRIADARGVSPDTVRTEFERICGVFGVHERFAAVMAAIQAGCIAAPQASSASCLADLASLEMNATDV